MNTVDELQTALMRLLDSIGSYTVERKKESIHVVRKRAFVGIHPKKSYLGVNIVLDRPTSLPAADKVERVSANRFHHYFKITKVQQLNRSFSRLLKQAFDQAGLKNKDYKEE